MTSRKLEYHKSLISSFIDFLKKSAFTPNIPYFLKKDLRVLFFFIAFDSKTLTFYYRGSHTSTVSTSTISTSTISTSTIFQCYVLKTVLVEFVMYYKPY